MSRTHQELSTRRRGNDGQTTRTTVSPKKDTQTAESTWKDAPRELPRALRETEVRSTRHLLTPLRTATPDTNQQQFRNKTTDQRAAENRGDPEPSCPCWAGRSGAAAGGGSSESRTELPAAPATPLLGRDQKASAEGPRGVSADHTHRCYSRGPSVRASTDACTGDAPLARTQRGVVLGLEREGEADPRPDVLLWEVGQG